MVSGFHKQRCSNRFALVFQEMVAKIGKSRRTLTRYIKQMQEKGILSREGADKNGYWKITN
jgi:predicted HTH transcriptional regulator